MDEAEFKILYDSVFFDDEADPDRDDGDNNLPDPSDLLLAFDLDGDLTLNFAEFEAVFELYGSNCPYDSAAEMFAQFDADQSGKLDALEFAELYECLQNGGDEDEDVTPTPTPEPTPTPVPEPDEDDATPTPAPVPTPDENTSDFTQWVHAQQIPETDYFCYLEIHNEWQNGYNFFAGHDCTIYDLTLTVMARRSDWDDYLEEINSDAKELGCEDIGTFDRACKFMVSPSNNKLGIRFSAEADVDLYYETEWANCLDNMLPVE